MDVLWLESRLEEAKSERIEITHVDSLEEAEHTLGKQKFEIILLDLGLPDSQGIETFFRIRSSASDIPIVGLAGCLPWINAPPSCGVVSRTAKGPGHPTYQDR